MEKFRSIQEDAFGRHKVSEPFTLFDSHNRYQLSDKFYNVTASGGSVTHLPLESSASMSITTTSGSSAIRESKTVTPYQPGKSLLILVSFVMAGTQPNLVQRAGYFGTLNGIFFEVVNGSAFIVKRNNGNDTRIPQAEWNMNSLIGILDVTKAQIFWVDIEWLGVGRVRTGFVIGGVQIPCHAFFHANFTTGVYMTTATLPLRFEIYNTGTLSTSASMKQICASVMSEGGYEIRTNNFSQLRTLTLTSHGVDYPSISLRLKSSCLDAVVLLNRIEIMITSADTVTWKIYKNASLTTGASWSSHSQSAFVEVDVSATAVTTTEAKIVSQGYAYQRETINIDFVDYNQQLSRTTAADIYTLVLTSDGSNTAVKVLMAWNEF